jgi:hypothetical protein
MVDVHQRVARLEGRVEEDAQMLTDVAGAVRHLEARMDERFAAVDIRLTALDQKLDQKTDALDRRLSGLDQKISGVEPRLEQRLDSQPSAPPLRATPVGGSALIRRCGCGNSPTPGNRCSTRSICARCRRAVR